MGSDILLFFVCRNSYAFGRKSVVFKGKEKDKEVR